VRLCGKRSVMQSWADFAEELEREERSSAERVAAYDAYVLNPGVKTAGADAALQVWSRTAVDMKDKLSDAAVRDEDYSVSGVAKINRTSVRYSNHVFSLHFDFIASTYGDNLTNGREFTRNLASELVSRYFARNHVRATSDLVSAVITIITELVAEIEKMEQAIDVTGSVRFMSRTITSKRAFWSLSCDIVVAVGLRLNATFGGKGMATRDALSLACGTTEGDIFEENRSLPLYVHVGGDCHPLRRQLLAFTLEWTNPNFKVTTLQGNVWGDFIVSNSIAYNAGPQIESFDYLRNPLHSGSWVNIFLPFDQFRARFSEVHVMASGKVSRTDWGSLDDGLREVQRADWSTGSMARVKFHVIGGVWECSANNMIVNDVGSGDYKTYGESNAVTIRMFARTGLGAVAPPVPSIQVLSDATGRRPSVVSLEIKGTPVRYPLVIDCVSASSVPVLHTILGKSTRHGPKVIGAPLSSTVSLSSAFGLQTPREIKGAISFILDAMPLFGPVFEVLTKNPERARIVEEQVNTQLGFGSSSGAIFSSLGDTRFKVLEILKQDENLALAYAFALSVAQSGMILCWLVFYIRAGICPVMLPDRPDRKLDNGVHSVAFIVKTTLLNWASVPDTSLPVSMGVIRDILSVQSRLSDCLTFCTTMFT